MTYSAGQVVEVCSERSRGWTSGFNYGSKITLTRLIPDDEACAGEWDALSVNGGKGIISEEDFRPVPEHSPVRTETVTVRRLEPGVYGRLSVAEDTAPYVSIALTSPDGTEVIERYRRSFSAPELRELARAALEIAEYLENA